MTGYVVNEDRTKLLLCYREKPGLWQPSNGPLSDDDVPHEVIAQYVLRDTGLEARYVADYDETGAGVTALILEADEDALSKYELEERYDAQWLTRDQILACTCVHEPAKDFAELLLAS
ncbi:MAG TPA: hypothetical protein VMT30_04225 [Candidatus Saccharimonadia bacterium]|nr:hypothetical protein [Candidatus Saccharimonadia bacterium]